jgi:hypothetical protein
MAAVWMAWTFAREGKGGEADRGLWSRGGIAFTDTRSLRLYNRPVAAFFPFKSTINVSFA